jgi:IS5 family transposase
MVELRFHQRTMWEGWFPEEASGGWEDWMKQADQVLDDEELLDSVYEAQGRRRPKSRRRGRKQTPAEVTLRLAVLKHVRNWSFDETEREVRANVVTGSLRGSEQRKFPMPRPWDGWCKPSARRWSHRFISDWWP